MNYPKLNWQIKKAYFVLPRWHLHNSFCKLRVPNDKADFSKVSRQLLSSTWQLIVLLLSADQSTAYSKSLAELDACPAKLWRNVISFAS